MSAKKGVVAVSHQIFVYNAIKGLFFKIIVVQDVKMDIYSTTTSVLLDQKWVIPFHYPLQ